LVLFEFFNIEDIDEDDDDDNADLFFNEKTLMNVFFMLDRSSMITELFLGSNPEPKFESKSISESKSNDSLKFLCLTLKLEEFFDLFVSELSELLIEP
jgi:hypothetical protein